MNSLDGPEFPVGFRQEVLKPIFSTLSAGDSCLVVGIGSVGKSNLLRSLQKEEVQRIYLHDLWDSFLFVYIDVNKTLEHSLWGLFELILHQIIIELTSKEIDGKVLQVIDDLHQRATKLENRYLALRYLDRAVRLVCYQLGLRLVFLIDEFDALCKVFSPADFAALRALRDDNKYRLMYVVASRSELHRLRDTPEELEAFEELVSLNTIWLGPFSKPDAEFALQRLRARHRVLLDERVQHALLVATGGHPGLLRAAHHVAINSHHDLLDSLVLSPQIRNECERIWNSLDHNEQAALKQIAVNRVIEEEQSGISEYLRCKGLIGGPWAGSNAVFSTLFAEFIKQNYLIPGSHVRIDRDRRVVWVDGRAIQGLSPLEFRFIEYLETKRGQVCSRDELAQHLYPSDVTYEGPGVSDARLGAIATRVRKEIEPDSENPQYIITVRGHGYKLVDKSENMN